MGSMDFSVSVVFLARLYWEIHISSMQMTDESGLGLRPATHCGAALKLWDAGLTFLRKPSKPYITGS